MKNQRQSTRDYAHLKEHIEDAKKSLNDGFKEYPPCRDCIKVRKNDRTLDINRDLNLALGMVNGLIERSEGTKRKTDRPKLSIIIKGLNAYVKITNVFGDINRYINRKLKGEPK